MSPIESRSRETSPRLYSVEIPGSEVATPTAAGAGTANTLSAPLLKELKAIPSSSSGLEIRSPISDQAPSPTGSPSLQKTSIPKNSIISTQPRYPAVDITHESLNSPTGRPPSHSPSIDVKFTNALNQLSSSELQQLFASLATANMAESGIMDVSSQSRQPSQITSNPAASQITPYKAPFDFGPLSDDPQSSNTPFNTLKPMEGIMSFDNNPYQIDQNWSATEDIDKHVDSVNSNIDTLIQTLGLDPSLLSTSNDIGSTGLDSSPMFDASALPSSALGTLDDPTQPTGPDDFFNSYLYSMPEGSNDNPILDFHAPSTTTAAPSPADSSTNTDSPDSVRPPDPPKGRKRKSDAPAEVAMKPPLPPTPRAKKPKK